jgi:hypothetical protein
MWFCYLLLLLRDRDSSVSIVTRLRTGRPGFNSRQELRIFLFFTAGCPYRLVAHPTSYPMNTGVISQGLKRPRREADHSPPSSAEVKNAWSCTSTHQYVFMAWYLIKHRENFTFSIIMTGCNRLCTCSTLGSRKRRYSFRHDHVEGIERERERERVG